MEMEGNVINWISKPLCDPKVDSFYGFDELVI